mgnify:CR=1 FL=1
MLSIALHILAISLVFSAGFAAGGAWCANFQDHNP